MRGFDESCNGRPSRDLPLGQLKAVKPWTGALIRLGPYYTTTPRQSGLGSPQNDAVLLASTKPAWLPKPARGSDEDYHHGRP